MKRLLLGRWMQLFAALTLLGALGWLSDTLLRLLSPWPKTTIVRLDYHPSMLCFSPDSKVVVTKNFKGRGDMLEMWDVETGARRLSYWVNENGFRDVIFSPNGTLIAAFGGPPSRLVLWDRTTGGLIVDVEYVCRASDTPRFTPDGRYILLADGGDGDGERIAIWDIAEQKRWKQIKGSFSSLQFSSDGKRFVVCNVNLGDYSARQRWRKSVDRLTVWLWELQGTTAPPRLLLERQVDAIGSIPPVAPFPFLGKEDTSAAIAFSPDLETFATAKLLPEPSTTLRLQTWDLATGKEMAQVTPEITNRHTQLGLKISGNGRFLQLTCGDTTLYSLGSNAELKQVIDSSEIPAFSLGDHSGAIAPFLDNREAVLSPDGCIRATLHDDKSIRLDTVSSRPPLGLILTMTTATWSLVLLACWWMKRRLRGGRHTALSVPPAV